MKPQTPVTEIGRKKSSLNTCTLLQPQESDSFLATWGGWADDFAANLINPFAPEYELLLKEIVKKVFS